MSEQPVRESVAGDMRDDAEPAVPEDAVSEQAAETPPMPEVEEAPAGGEPADAAESPAEDESPAEPVEEPVAEQEPEASDDMPAEEILEAQVEVVEETPATDLDPAATVPEAEDEAQEAEPVAESPVEPVEAATAEVLETPDAGGVPEPEEETIAEAPPEVAEEIEQPAAAVAEVAEPAAAVAEAAVEEEPAGRDPFKGPGDWYVVHTYAGYENKVKANLESRIGSMQMQDKIFDVEIPMEDVMEIKGGKKQVVQKKVFPGYLLVKMVYDNDSWYVVRNTPGVTGFVSSGTGTKPTPLSKREVEKILTVPKQEVKPQFRLEFEEGDVVRIISGPFADFNGTVDEINVDQSKLKVLVNIFDRETPVELGFDQVAKV